MTFHSCKNLVPDLSCQSWTFVPDIPMFLMLHCGNANGPACVRLSVAFGLVFKNRVLIENRFEYMIFDDARFIHFAVKHIGAKHRLPFFGEWLNLKMSLVVKRIRERD